MSRIDRVPSASAALNALLDRGLLTARPRRRLVVDELRRIRHHRIVPALLELAFTQLVQRPLKIRLIRHEVRIGDDPISDASLTVPRSLALRLLQPSQRAALPASRPVPNDTSIRISGK